MAWIRSHSATFLLYKGRKTPKATMLGGLNVLNILVEPRGIEPLTS